MDLTPSLEAPCGTPLWCPDVTCASCTGSKLAVLEHHPCQCAASLAELRSLTSAKCAVAVAVQTLGFMVVLSGFVMAFLMHRAGHAHEEFAAPSGLSAPLGDADSGALGGNPLGGRRRRLLHEHHDDPARGRVAELHALVGYVVLGLITLQVRLLWIKPLWKPKVTLPAAMASCSQWTTACSP